VRDKLIYILGVLAVILLARDLYLITGFPPERNQGVNVYDAVVDHIQTLTADGIREEEPRRPLSRIPRHAHPQLDEERGGEDRDAKRGNADRDQPAPAASG